LDARDYVGVRLHDEYYDKGCGGGAHRQQCGTSSTRFATSAGISGPRPTQPPLTRSATTTAGGSH